MREIRLLFAALLIALSAPIGLLGQSAQTPPSVSIPRLVSVTGVYQPANGQPPPPGTVVTLLVYADQQGGTPLWQETQNVEFDASGRYSLLLGASLADGIPADVFASGDAKWLALHFAGTGDVEGPRSRITSVPYALRSADADTLGGKPASAYVLAEPATSTSTSATTKTASTKSNQSATTQSATTGWIPVATDNNGGEGNSVMFQSALNFIGVGTTTPNDAMHAVVNDPNGNFTGYAVQNLSGGAAAYSGMLFYDQNGALTQFQGFNNVTHEYRINNIARNGSNQFNGSINFMLGGASKFLVANNGNIGIGTNAPTLKLDVAGDINMTGSLRQGGLTLLATDNAASNVAVGTSALGGVTTGSSNTAVGTGALSQNSEGTSNTAVGTGALSKNIGGGGNTALGTGALFNSTGFSNVAIGAAAMLNNTSGDNNAALGNQALSQNTTGAGNTAVGKRSLSANTTGVANAALGGFAGSDATTGNYNIFIGHEVFGSSADTNLIRIGFPYNGSASPPAGQNQTFIAGIRGITTGAADAVAVVIDSNGQLGTINSSRRYKEDIRDMADTSSGLMRLRPVTYRYKQAYADGTKPIDYGLIAEEVEEVYPDLVAHLADGEVETVQYQKINAMLLNEVQKQHRQLEEQRSEIELLKARLTALERPNP